MTRKDRRLVDFMEGMCQSMHEAMTKLGLARRTCIAHTRVAAELGRRKRFRAELACGLVVLSTSAYAKVVQLGGELEADECESEDHSLGIGYGQHPESSGYAHVLTVVERRWLLDLTLDQANRPQYAIELRPGYFALPDGFLAGVTPAVMVLNGSFVRYQAMPDDRGFLAVPDWTMIRPDSIIVRELAS